MRSGRPSRWARRSDDADADADALKGGCIRPCGGQVGFNAAPDPNRNSRHPRPVNVSGRVHERPPSGAHSMGRLVHPRRVLMDHRRMGIDTPPLVADPKGLLLELRCEWPLSTLLELVTSRLAESPRVALARVWLIRKSQDCTGLPDGGRVPGPLALPAPGGQRRPIGGRSDGRLDADRRGLPPVPAGGAEGRPDRGDGRADRGPGPVDVLAGLGRPPGMGEGRGDRRVRRPAAGLPGRGAGGARRVRPRDDRRRLHGLAAADRRPRRRRHRRGPGVRGDRGAPQAAGTGERIPARGGDAGRSLRRAHRPEPGARGGRAADRPRRPDRRGGPDPRRERDRQGAGRPRDPPAEPAGRAGRSSR